MSSLNSSRYAARSLVFLALYLLLPTVSGAQNFSSRRCSKFIKAEQKNDTASANKYLRTLKEPPFKKSKWHILFDYYSVKFDYEAGYYTDLKMNYCSGIHKLDTCMIFYRKYKKPKRLSSYKVDSNKIKELIKRLSQFDELFGDIPTVTIDPDSITISNYIVDSLGKNIFSIRVFVSLAGRTSIENLNVDFLNSNDITILEGNSWKIDSLKAHNDSQNRILIAKCLSNYCSEFNTTMIVKDAWENPIARISTTFSFKRAIYEHSNKK